MDLKILQWNARSVIANKGNLEQFLVSEQISIGIISESWFKPGSNVYIKNFYILRNDREDGRGGVAILIKNNINFEPLTLTNNKVMIVGAKVKIPNHIIPEFYLYSVYKKPQTKLSELEWSNIFHDLQKPFVFAGDLNVHHVAWGCQDNNVGGINLLNAIEDHHIILLNDGACTRINRPDQRKSAVDLTLVSDNIASLIDWKVLPESLGSDHLVILLEISPKSTENVNTRSQEKFNLKKIDWDKFRFYTEQQLTEDKDITYETFIDILTTIIESSIPKNKEHRQRKANKGKYWWDQACSKAVQERKNALTSYKQVPTMENFVNYQKTNATVKKTILAAKRKKWYEFCESLNSQTPLKEVWQNINKIKNVYKPRSQGCAYGDWCFPFLDRLVPCHVETQQLFDNGFSPIITELEQHITFSEFQSTLKNKANSAPGMDKIAYSVVFNLPTQSKLVLLKFFNEILSNHKIPNDWKQYLVVPVLKPNKIPFKPESYRPISLSSCILKQFERIIKNRIVAWLESNNKMPRTQYGFRSQKSCMEVLTIFLSDISIAFANYQSISAIFLDIEGAYDKVVHSVLIDKMTKIGLPLNLIKLIMAIISNRKVFLKINSELIGPRITNVGLPQGSILSPVLYLIYTYDLEEMFASDVKILQFADDICVYSTGPSIRLINSDLEYALQKVQKWMHINGLTISVQKSKMCTFTRENVPLRNGILLDHAEIEYVPEVKYLGMILDQKLTYKSHINEIIRKAEQNFNVLRATTHLKWGATPTISLIIYKSFVRSILDYGAIWYGQCSKTLLQKLESIHNKCIRLCLGYLRSTPIDVLLAESTEIPFKLRIKLLADRFVFKSYEQNRENVYNKIHELTTTVLTSQFWIHKPNPPLCDSYERINYKCKELNSNQQNPGLALVSFFQSDIVIPIVKIPDYANLPKELRNAAFKNDIKEKYPNYIEVFTDGSKLESKTGAAFFIPQLDVRKLIKVNSYASVYTAEQIAIIEALRFINTRQEEKFIVFTDCKSAIDKLRNIYTSTKITNLTANIIIEIKNLHGNHKSVVFSWIRGHINIEGNEVVDVLAKEATQVGGTCSHKIPKSDLYVLSKEYVRKEFERNFFTGEKGKLYKAAMTSLPSKPWFYEGNLNKNIVSTVNRLRANHGLFPAHKFKIGLADTPFCSCNEIGTIEHILLECSNFINDRNEFLNTLYKTDIIKPFNTNAIIFSQCTNVIILTCKFLRKIGINI